LAELCLRVILILTSRDPEKGRRVAAQLGENVFYHPVVMQLLPVYRIYTYTEDRYGQEEIDKKEILDEEEIPIPPADLDGVGGADFHCTVGGDCLCI